MFENDIEWLAATGITRGCNPPGTDHFCPTDPVTRGEMAAFLHRSPGEHASDFFRVPRLSERGETD